MYGHVLLKCHIASCIFRTCSSFRTHSLYSSDLNIFLMSPQPSLAPFGSIATFTCRVSEQLVEYSLWEVNGGHTTTPQYARVLIGRGISWNSTEDRERGWTSMELKAAATTINNGTTIQCVAYIPSTQIFTETPVVTLTVYGMYTYVPIIY